MTITQLIQANAAKANELIAKLADTSDGAVKTREKLLSELKDQLDLLARSEEEHLFPVLRRHKETKDLVSGAIDDNKQIRTLLTELEQMPKNDDGFAGKLAELRKIFQQHVRDEKKELLPAVRKALSDEEAEHREAEARESERRAREDAAAALRAAESAAESAVKVGSTAARAGGDMVAEGARRGAGLAARAVERTATSAAGATRAYDETVRPAIRQLDTFATLPGVVANAASDTNRVWVEWMGKTAETGIRASQSLMGLRSPQQIVAVQSRFVQETLQAWMEAGRKMVQISVHASEDVLQPTRRQHREERGGQR